MSHELSSEEIKACKDLDVLLDALKNRSFYGDRKAAATALGNLGNEQAIGPLIQALDDEDKDVRKAAAEALAVIGAASVAHLAEVLDRKESSVSARTNAVEALSKIEDARCAEYIIRALKDNRASVRWTAAFCLGDMECQEAVDPLILALNDEDFLVRDNAVFALQRTGDVKAVDPLIQVLNDESPDVRCSAVRALGNIGDKRVLKPLTRLKSDTNPLVRECVDIALSDLKKRSIKKW
jgi:HEAT repeat protein